MAASIAFPDIAYQLRLFETWPQQWGRFFRFGREAVNGGSEDGLAESLGGSLLLPN
jgi:hypothetical protein